MAEIETIAEDVKDLRDRVTRVEVVSLSIEKLEKKVDILTALTSELSTKIAVIATKVAIYAGLAAGAVTLIVNLAT